MILRPLLLAFALIGFSVPEPSAAEAHPVTVFSAREGVAIGGYDVVAFFERGEARRGRRGNAVMWKGVIWRFSSARNQALFEANPRAYAPAFGGYCAYALSQGRLRRGDPRIWTIFSGELYLLNNPDAADRWRGNAAPLITAAAAHWPAILRE
ncbi:YHS domain-containing (seleno)protein [Cribrihabitans neustonicus]|uniref:YHS domain-containing (seleno)protein n=1 Tax=Cribrihabitans neustonicus TaxID=1429085 RepID=UPI003B591E68